MSSAGGNGAAPGIAASTIEIAPEEAARADFYGLLARLLFAPADQEFLRSLAEADELDAEAGELAEAWSALIAAAALAEADAVRDEYESLFLGTGRAQVTLYTGAYMLRFTNDVPLAELRQALAGLGMVRRSESEEPEDHIAALCEVMRLLITSDPDDLARQAAFFARWIGRAYDPLCSAIDSASGASFYLAVSRLTRSFFNLEHKSFDLI